MADGSLSSSGPGSRKAPARRLSRPHHHYFAEAVGHLLSPKQIARDVREVQGANAKVAVLLTRIVGTMWCFYVFNVIAVPAVVTAVTHGQLLPIINAVSSNWLQLILLPGIMVGQAVMQVAADHRAESMAVDLDHVKRFLSYEEEGGVKRLMDRIDELEDVGLRQLMDRLNELEDTLGKQR